jgi:hypothetical protein
MKSLKKYGNTINQYIIDILEDLRVFEALNFLNRATYYVNEVYFIWKDTGITSFKHLKLL